MKKQKQIKKIRETRDEWDVESCHKYRQLLQPL